MAPPRKSSDAIFANERRQSADLVSVSTLGLWEFFSHARLPLCWSIDELATFHRATTKRRFVLTVEELELGVCTRGGDGAGFDVLGSALCTGSHESYGCD